MYSNHYYKTTSGQTQSPENEKTTSRKKRTAKKGKDFQPFVIPS